MGNKLKISFSILSILGENRSLSLADRQSKAKLEDCQNLELELTSCKPNRRLLEMVQDDPRLVKLVHKCVIVPPPPDNGTRMEEIPIGKLRGQVGQAKKIDKFYGGKKNGFFVEVGAHDGIFASNTLLFEQHRNWTGLLIEPNKTHFSRLSKLGRRAFLANTCLSTAKRPKLMHLDQSGIAQLGRVYPEKIIDPFDAMNVVNSYDELTCMVCIPMYTLLLAIENPTVDLFVLDIEGAEMPVIRSIPFHKVDVRLWDIETAHMGKIFNGKQEALKKHMETKGYLMHSVLSSLDTLYVKKGTLLTGDGYLWPPRQLSSTK